MKYVFTILLICGLHAVGHAQPKSSFMTSLFGNHVYVFSDSMNTNDMQESMPNWIPVNICS